MSCNKRRFYFYFSSITAGDNPHIRKKTLMRLSAGLRFKLILKMAALSSWLTDARYHLLKKKKMPWKAGVARFVDRTEK